MALQAGFSSVINSHSTDSVPMGRTATNSMTHSMNWSTIGIVQTSVLQTRSGWKRRGPAAPSIAP